MASWLAELDPEVRGLLEDVARQGSILLRLDPGAESIDPLQENLRLDWTAPGMASAERELLRAHREELWLLLHRAFCAKKLQDPLGLAVSPPNPRSGNISSTQLALAGKRLQRVPDAPTGVLSALVEGDLAKAGYREIAIAACRAVDNESTRLLVAESDILTGRYQEALRAAQPVSERAVRPDLRVSALSLVGGAYGELGHDRLALESVGQAFELDSGHPILCCSYFMASLFARDPARCREASATLEHHYPTGSRALSSQIQAYILRWGGRTPFSREFFGAVADSLSPSARALIHGITT